MCPHTSTCLSAVTGVILRADAALNRHSAPVDPVYHRLSQDDLLRRIISFPSTSRAPPRVIATVFRGWHRGVPLGVAQAVVDRSRIRITGCAGSTWFGLGPSHETVRISTPKLMSGLEYHDDWLDHEESYFFDWSCVQPYRWRGWRSALAARVSRFRLRLPPSWLDVPSDYSAFQTSGSSLAKRLRTAASSRVNNAPGPIKTARNSCLKFLWFCICHELNTPLCEDSICIYMEFLREQRDNLGSVTDFLNSINFLSSYQASPFSSLSSQQPAKLNLPYSVTSLKNTCKKDFKSCPRITLGLEPFMIHDILFIYVRHSRVAWQISVGISISVSYKLCMRYDCASRLRWDDSYCVVSEAYIRFYLDGCKNLQYKGRWCDVAKPDDGSFGVYHALIRGKTIFKTGFVLARILGHNGDNTTVDTNLHMSRDQFISHVRTALQVIGVERSLTLRFSGKSPRMGAAASAVTAQLSTAEIAQLSRTKSANWVAHYDERNLSQRLAISRALGC